MHRESYYLLFEIVVTYPVNFRLIRGMILYGFPLILVSQPLLARLFLPPD